MVRLMCIEWYSFNAHNDLERTPVSFGPGVFFYEGGYIECQVITIMMIKHF